MKKLSNSNICLFILFLAVSALNGCISIPRQEVIGPESKKNIVEVDPLISAKYLENKISSLEKIKKDNDSTQTEKDLAKRLLSNYEKIGSIRVDPGKKDDLNKLLRLILNNLDLLENRLLHGEQNLSEPSLTISEYSKKRKEIMDQYLFDNHNGVITKCIELEAEFGKDSLTPDIGLMFSISLSKEGKIKEALRVGESVVRQLEGYPDSIDLRAKIIEWYLSIGNKKNAVIAYEKLTDDINEKENAHRVARVRFKTSDDLFEPDLKPPEPEDTIDQDDTEESAALRSIKKALKEFLDENNFQQAKILLIRNRLRLENSEDIASVDMLLEQMENAERKYLSRIRDASFRENETAGLIKKLIEEEKYEEAILKIEGLPIDSKENGFVVKLHEKAVDGIISRDRNKAAKLFLKARNTNNKKQKIEFLSSSYELIKILIEKYPFSSSINKLKDNAGVIQEELSKAKFENG